MNKSLAPLIIGLAVVILLTMILISTQTPYMERKNYSDDSGNGEVIKMRLSPYAPRRTSSLGSINGRPEKKVDSEDLREMYLTALDMYHRSRFAEAEKNVRTVLVFEPDNAKALMLYGRLLYRKEKYKEAEAIYRRLAKMQPESPMVYNNLGQSLAKQYRFIEAIDILSTAHEKDPESPIISLNLAGAHAVLGDKEKATEFFKEAYRQAGDKVLPAAKDPTLKSLREDPDFQKFIKEAESKSASETGDDNIAPAEVKPQTP